MPIVKSNEEVRAVLKYQGDAIDWSKEPIISVVRANDGKSITIQTETKVIIMTSAEDTHLEVGYNIASMQYDIRITGFASVHIHQRD